MTPQEEIIHLRKRLAELEAQIYVNERQKVDAEREFYKTFICDIVSTYYGVTVDDLASLKRNRIFVEPRHLVFWLLYESKQFKYTLYEIGRVLNRDHSTVIHANKTINNTIQYNKEKNIEYKALKNKIFNYICKTNPKQDETPQHFQDSHVSHRFA
jgi:chromosomal replication initiation ATPase DnaA